MQEATKNKLILGSVFLIGSLMFLSLLFRTLSTTGKTTIKIKTAPRQAVIKLNGKKTGSSPALSAGTYDLEVSYDGFTSYKEKFVITKDSKSSTKPIALEPKSQDAKNIAQTQGDLYQELEQEAGKQAAAASVKFSNENPILNNIPYQTDSYKINYGKDTDGNFELEIKAETPVTRQVALEQIRIWGFEPSDYRIVFVGTINPFQTPTGDENAE